MVRLTALRHTTLRLDLCRRMCVHHLVLLCMLHIGLASIHLSSYWVDYVDKTDCMSSLETLPLPPTPPVSPPPPPSPPLPPHFSFRTRLFTSPSGTTAEVHASCVRHLQLCSQQDRGSGEGIQLHAKTLEQFPL